VNFVLISPEFELLGDSKYPSCFHDPNQVDLWYCIMGVGDNPAISFCILKILGEGAYKMQGNLSPADPTGSLQCSGAW